jgi:serine/threonine-protein kinase
MSPEQAQGKALDRRVDVWAVGVVAWELFSGSRLHDGTNDPVLMLKIAREPPMRLRHVRPDLPREFDAVLAGALSMDPRSRPSTAEAFADALREAAEQAGVKAADAREVRDFVLGLVGPELEARRDKVAEIRALRQRWVELGGPSGSAAADRPRADAAPRPPLVEQLEATVAHGPVLPARAPRRASGLGSLLTVILTAPLLSRAWVVASILPAVALALAYVVASDGTPKVTRAVSMPATTSSASAPPATPSASAPSTAPSERVLTPADLGEIPPADAALDVDGVITPFELGIEPPHDAPTPGAPGRPRPRTR